jgi:predicted 3-demethylubiquinone-9 3-methyltransferase (glyoxalase superfamily)
VGPWPAGKIATITLEWMGQPMTFLKGGPAQTLTPAFSYTVACQDQAEIDFYWDQLLEGGRPMACGWLTDKFGLCWQIVPENVGEILKHPKAMGAMMNMVKFDIAALEAAKE